VRGACAVSIRCAAYQRPPPLTDFRTISKTTAPIVAEMIVATVAPPRLVSSSLEPYERCPFMALSGSARAADECLLSGVKQTSQFRGVTSANDPKQ
jgi:hypothetical protein